MYQPCTTTPIGGYIMKHHTEEHVNKEIDSKEVINTVIEPHNHRAIIGFDKNGIPKVLVLVSGHTHKHIKVVETIGQ